MVNGRTEASIPIWGLFGSLSLFAVRSQCLTAAQAISVIRSLSPVTLRVYTTIRHHRTGPPSIPIPALPSVTIPTLLPYMLITLTHGNCYIQDRLEVESEQERAAQHRYE